MVLEEKVEIFEVSEFSILPYTQNWKLGNLGKFSFTSDFDISRNLRFKNKNELKQILSRLENCLRRKNENFWGFGVFNFVLYPKFRTWKFPKDSFTVVVT